MSRIFHTFAVILLALSSLQPAHATLPSGADSIAKKTAQKKNKQTRQPTAIAQSYDPATSQKIVRDAAILYDVLIGYLQLQRGATEHAYTHCVSAAQRNPNSELSAQATEVALHKRA